MSERRATRQLTFRPAGLREANDHWLQLPDNGTRSSQITLLLSLMESVLEFRATFNHLPERKQNLSSQSSS